MHPFGGPREGAGFHHGHEALQKIDVEQLDAYGEIE